MQAVTTIGLDIAKSVFQVHGVDADSRHTALRSSHVRFGGEPEMSGRTACLISTPSAWRSI
jgi:transposase